MWSEMAGLGSDQTARPNACSQAVRCCWLGAARVMTSARWNTPASHQRLRKLQPAAGEVGTWRASTPSFGGVGVMHRRPIERVRSSERDRRPTIQIDGTKRRIPWRAHDPAEARATHGARHRPPRAPAALACRAGVHKSRRPPPEIRGSARGGMRVRPVGSAGPRCIMPAGRRHRAPTTPHRRRQTRRAA